MPIPITRFALVCALLATLLVAAPAHAADAPFSLRFAQTLRGNLSAVGNTLMTCPSAAANCAAARSGSPYNDNDFTMGYVDVDADATTFDSSSATLTLPAGSTVVWAGLYWAADTSGGTGGLADTHVWSRDQVKLAVGSSGYATVSAASGNVLTSSSQPTRYRAFADVTSRVTGSGTYTVANVKAGTGQDRFAGWALFVAYRDSAQSLRHINVFDGLGTVDATHTFSTTIAPFQTPATGAVTTTTGLLSFEGDLGYATETMTFNGAPVSDTLNPANNVFNSTISANGANVAAKSPNYVNQLGMDLDAKTATGALANSQSSTTLSFTSTQDYYMPSAFFLVSDEGPAVNTAAPTISGTPGSGSTLTADPGDWQGTPTITYTYQWQRCDAAGANCVDISGATGSTYDLTDADVGHTVRVIVVANNDAGASNPATSAAGPLVLKPPANATRPQVSGTPKVGQTLMATLGAWTGSDPLTYAYQWQRCDASGANCVDIAGATDRTYTLTDADAGHAIVVVVTAANSVGQDSASSTPTDATASAAPGGAGGVDSTPASSTTGGNGGARGTTDGAGGPPSGASTDAPVAATGDVAGTLLGVTSCQQLAGNAKYRRVKLAGIGTVRVRAYTTGAALQTAPVLVSTEITGGRAKRVRYQLDGKALRAGRAPRYAGSITPAQLGRTGAHALKALVTGKRGTKTVALTLKTVACTTLFTAQRWRTTAGAGLRLRVDARRPVTQLAFAVPAALLPKQTASPRTIGFIRVWVAGSSKRQRFELKLPKRGAATIALRGSGRPTVRYVRGGVQVTGLPLRAAIVEVTLYRVTNLDRATTKRRYTLRAKVSAEGAAVATLTAKPRAPR
jgi:hypothetical protein